MFIHADTRARLLVAAVAMVLIVAGLYLLAAA